MFCNPITPVRVLTCWYRLLTANSGTPFDDDRHPFTPAIEYFHDVLLDNEQLAVPATNALGTLAIVEAIAESTRTGKRVTL